jgi:hypothetical protein
VEQASPHQRIDSANNVVEREWACNGEYVRVSPRYMKNGSTFRVRPERPAAFFAAFLHERGLVPVLLTAEECEQEEVLQFLDPLWAKYSGAFYKLESPLAACDQATVPSHRNGFSFCVLQVLVEEVGTVQGGNGTPASLAALQTGAANADHLDALRKQIELLRAKGGGTNGQPAKSKK